MRTGRFSLKRPKLTTWIGNAKKITLIILVAIVAVALVLLLFVFDVAGLRAGRAPQNVAPPPEQADETVLKEKQLARFIHMSENEILGEFGKPVSTEEGDHTVHYTQETYPYRLLEFKDENSYSYSFMFIDGTLNNFHVSTSGTLGIPFSGDAAQLLADLGFETGPGMSVDRQTERITVCRDVSEDIEYINIDSSEDGNFVYNLFFMLDSSKY